MKNANLILIAVVASLGGLLFGYDTGVINGTQFYFSKYFDLDAAMKGWVVGSALLGCLVGAIVSGALSNAIGRKKSLILSALLFTISAWGSGLPEFLPQSVPLLVVFRIIGGLGIGIASMNAPTYIAELSPAKIRGKMVSYYQMAIVVGFFVVFLATYAIGQSGDEVYNLNKGWRLMFWSELIPCLIFLFLLFLVPRSPRWLMLKGYDDEAMRVLEKIHGAELAKVEMEEIKHSIGKEKGLPFKDIFKKTVFPIVLIGSVLSGLQQFTGINAVLYYGADIFEKALGFGQEDVLAQQILLAGVNFAFTFIAMFSVDRWGRKPLIISGSIGMIVGFSMLGLSLKSQSDMIMDADRNDPITFIEKTQSTLDKLDDKLSEGSKTAISQALSDLQSVSDSDDEIEVESARKSLSSAWNKGYGDVYPVQNKASLFGILIFIASFAMSMGPIVWVLLSEMFPNSIRSAAMSVAVAVQWAMNYVVSQSFPVVVDSGANQGDFWKGSLPYFIFIAFIAVIIWLTMKYIPETKGKSLEQLEGTWEERYGKIS